MEVVLISYTDMAEAVCAIAMRGCQTNRASFEINIDDAAIQKMIELAKSSKHLSVLEHCTFTFSVKGISRACSHQLVRHRLASFSQQSQRHVTPTKIYDWYVTPKSIVDLEDTQNVKKGEALAGYYDLMDTISNLYVKLVAFGVPVEDARFVLPNACKTNIVVTMNARELLHFFRLRLSKDAQWEIRELAEKMLAVVQPIAPMIFKDAGTYDC